MDLTAGVLGNDFIKMIVILDPFVAITMFLALTREHVAARTRIATLACVIAAALLIVFVSVGQAILDALGIGLYSFRIAGGLVLAVSGLRMVFETDRAPAYDMAGRRVEEVAAFPIAMPVIVGPGAILTAVMLTDNDIWSTTQRAAKGGVFLLALACVYGALLAAAPLARWIGATGLNVISRVMGLIVVAIATQAVLSGVVGYFGIIVPG